MPERLNDNIRVCPFSHFLWQKSVGKALKRGSQIKEKHTIWVKQLNI